jgi:MFS family permease
MVGVGEAYLPAFALALGIHDIGAGLVATIPLALGSFLQIISPRVVRHLGSRRLWVSYCALVQAISFLPLIVAAVLGHLSLFGIYLIATVYWGAGMATGATWNTWVTRLVPRQVRIGFFSHRSGATQIAILVGLGLGGTILAISASWKHPLHGFALLFLLAATCRFLSAWTLRKQSEIRPIVADRIVGFRDLIQRTWTGEDGRLLGYLAGMMAAVMIAGPFFTPFMLIRLELGYTAYMFLLAASFAAKVIALPLLGRAARHWGAKRLLLMGGLGIFPLPLLWLINQTYPYLLALQLLSGVAWAAHELAAFLLFFDTLKEEERTSLLTSFNVMNALATLGGSLLGGAILAVVGADTAGYRTIFLVSTGLRLVVLGYGFRVTDKPLLTARILIRTIAIRPAFGGLGRPLQLRSFKRNLTSQPTGKTNSASKNA